MDPATLVNLSDASTTLTNVGAYSAPVFQTLSPFAFLVIGLSVGGILVSVFIAVVIGAFHSFWARHSTPGSKFDH